MTPLEKFAIAVLREHRNYGAPTDLDGGWLQDTAEELGLLVKVRVTEPCGEDCSCVEYDDFPQDCLRYSDEIWKMLHGCAPDATGDQSSEAFIRELRDSWEKA